MAGHIAVFGRTEGGKTTLCKFISRKTARVHKMGSIVLDPHVEIWGPQAQVYPFTDEGELAFWQAVHDQRRKAIFLEEATDTVARRKDLRPIFTRIRHQDHKLVVSGHRAADALLPIMKGQISTLYLGRTDKKDAQEWVEHFADDRIMQATKLDQYQFLLCQMFRTPIVVQGTDYYDQS